MTRAIPDDATSEISPRFLREVAGTSLWTGMTNTLNPKFRTAGSVLAGLTVTLAATAFAVAPASAASADDYNDWRTNFGTSPSADFDHDGDVDGRDFLAWQRSTSEIGDPVTFTYTVTNTSFTPDGRQLVVTIKDGPM
jgi:hypothetical protein